MLVVDWVRKYLQKQDRFGVWAKFNYNGKAKLGTSPGGCASLILWYFSTIFLCVQLYGFLFEPSYSERGSTSYIPESKNVTYDVGTADYLPAFMITTHFTKDDGSSVVTINDPTIYDYSF